MQKCSACRRPSVTLYHYGETNPEAKGGLCLRCHAKSHDIGAEASRITGIARYEEVVEP